MFVRSDLILVAWPAPPLARKSQGKWRGKSAVFPLVPDRDACAGHPEGPETILSWLVHHRPLQSPGPAATRPTESCHKEHPVLSLWEPSLWRPVFTGENRVQGSTKCLWHSVQALAPRPAGRSQCPASCPGARAVSPALCSRRRRSGQP